MSNDSYRLRSERDLCPGNVRAVVWIVMVETPRQVPAGCTWLLCPPYLG
jgi:hypothetical protein